MSIEDPIPISSISSTSSRSANTDAEDRQAMAEVYSRKSKIAFGMCLICAMFGLETSTAHRVNPNPASPFIWGVLAVAGIAAVAAGFWLRAKAATLAAD
jgi:hypothetical protein